MKYRGLAEFLEDLQYAGQLTRVEASVEAKLEIAEISGRLSARDDRAVLFEQVGSGQMAVVTGLFASAARLTEALDAESPDQLADRLFAAEEPARPAGLLLGRWAAAATKNLMETASGEKFQPNLVSTGSCQQVLRLASDVCLERLPALQLAPREPTVSITAANIVSRPRQSGHSHLSRCDLRVIDSQQLALDGSGHDDVARDLQTYREHHEKMPLAVVLGAHPALDLIAIGPLGQEIDALQLAGQVASRPLEVVSCRTNQLTVPAVAEIVIEGFIDPDAAVWSGGAYVCPTGFYHTNADLEVMQVTAITHRANPVFPAILVGQPNSEQQTLYGCVHRMLMPWIRAVAPEVVDCSLPALAVAGSVALVSIRKTFAQQGRKVAAALWGHRWMMHTKLLVLVDEDVDVNDTGAVMAEIAMQAHPKRDVFFHQGPGDRFDHAAPIAGAGAAMAIDATKKLPGEHPRQWPETAAMSQEIRDLVSRRWSEYGLAETNS